MPEEQEEHLQPSRAIDAPSVLVALGALALWALWPGGMQPMSSSVSVPEPSASYVRLRSDEKSLHMSPELIALPSAVGFGAREEAGDMPEVFNVSRHRAPRYLARARAGQTGSVPADSARAVRQARDSLSGYVPRWGDRTVFNQHTDTEMRLTVEPRGALREHGFSTPPLDDADLKQLEKPWTVTVVVDVGENGRPEHVFVEKGCDQVKVNDMVTRMIYKGQLERPGAGCSGRVVVNFGVR